MSDTHSGTSHASLDFCMCRGRTLNLIRKGPPCCLFPICKCMLNKAIYFSWSQGSPSINLSLIVCSGCNYPCRSQRPTFKLETKFLWTNNNDTSMLPDCFARQSYLKRFLHTCSCTEEERMRDHQSPKLLQPPIF